MTRASFPEIPQAALRNHASPERVERVWRRLELSGVRPARAKRAALVWAPAAALIFGVGVLTGTRLQPSAVEVAAVAEPRAPLPMPGAAAAVEERALQPVAPADSPARKRERTPRALPSGNAAAAPLGEAYAEPSGPSAAEPALTAGPAEWEKLAETGEFRAANEALARSGGFELAASRASAGQLLILADIARASGNRERATQALRRLLSVYVSAPEAPLAAWTLGNLLEQAGDRAGAAEAYATYRRLSPAGDFAEDAAARQVDVALSQGNLELGTRALEEYAQNFPKGRRLSEMRKRLAALAAPAVDDVAPTETEDEEEVVEPGAEAPAAPPASPH